MDSNEVNQMIQNALMDYATTSEVQEKIEMHEDAVVESLDSFQTEFSEKMDVVVQDLQHKNEVLYGFNTFLGVLVGAVLIKYLLDRF